MFTLGYGLDISMFLGGFQLSYTALQLVKYQSSLVSAALMVFSFMANQHIDYSSKYNIILF